MKDCPFCYDNIADRVVAEQNSVVAIQDSYPVTDGHLLIVPKRHMANCFAMNETEKQDSLRSQIVTLKRGQHSKYSPFAFTEQGEVMHPFKTTNN